MSLSDNIKQKLFQPVDAIGTGLFLRAFGIIIIVQAAGYGKYDFIEKGVLAPKFLFRFDYFEFIRPLSGPAMKFMMLLMLASGLMLVFRKWVKAALALFLLTFSYFFLLDKCYYNNHFYLFILVSLIYLFYREQDGEKGVKTTPYWFLLLMQVQIVIVYFYGGLAKLNADWMLRQQPLRILLRDSASNSLLPDLTSSTFVLYLLTYGGLLFDLCIGFMLWYRPTRKVAMILAVAFNLSNTVLFNFGDSGDIGGFPLFMIFTLLLFADPARLRARLQSWTGREQNSEQKKGATTTAAKESQSNAGHTIVIACLALYIGFQLLFPLRHLLYPGDTSWTAKGSKFSWRMKVNNKVGDIRFFVRAKAGDSLREINTGAIINSVQRYNMADDPVMIWQFAQFIGEEMSDRGATHPEVYARAYVSLNGKTPAPIVDSNLNLLNVGHDRLALDKWILPLKN